MHRLTVYLTDELYDAIVAHAEAAGQKLSTFVGRELAHLVSEPVEVLTPNVTAANFRRRKS